MACPANPPPPDGFRIWRRPVPRPLTEFAIGIRDQIAKYPLRTQFGTWYNGEYVVARVDSHSWTYVNGQLVTGLCIKGVTLFEAVPTVALTSYNPVTDTLDTPDPNAAVFDAPPGPDWPLVALSAGAAAGVEALFLWALKAAGQAKRRRHRSLST